MVLHSRPYRVEEDYWRMRAFLRELFLKNNRLERAWQTYRLDYWRWHGIENLSHGNLETHVFLWERPDGELAAVLNAEGPGSAFLQVDPAYEEPALIREMIETAEMHLAHDTGMEKKLHFWINENHDLRQALLLEKGYAQGPWVEHQRRRPLNAVIPDVQVEEGYDVRSLGGIEELPSRAWASWKSFHPNDPDEDYDGWDWYLNIQRCPQYRRDLDIVAIAPNGEVAAFCTVWFDDVTRTGSFEPVGTHSAHWRRGLGKAVMAEGLRRLRRLGANLAYVGSYEEPAHRLYESMGFVEYEKAVQWTAKWER